jgi:pimeloyl-ACP methyl ester carboxylesterase
VEIEERRERIGSLEVNRRSAGHASVLYVHGVPTAAFQWDRFLERTGGVAPDLPGFGSSDKPPHFDYSIQGYGDFLETFVDALGMERFSLVAHDWGAVGLELARRRPESVERLVLLSTVPLVEGYRWHRLARGWRRPLVGEFIMAATTRWGLRRAMPTTLADPSWERFDHGTQRAILKLYRSAPPEVLARAGEGLDRVRAPALVLWPTADPYIGSEFGAATAESLGGPVELEMVESGHWMWDDRPELVDRVADFLGRPLG